MSESEVVYVQLVRGASFRTPFGLTIRQGQNLRVSPTSPHLEYYRASSRFRVLDSVSSPRTKAARLPRGGRARPAREPMREAAKPAAPVGKPAAPVIDLSTLTRKQLVDAAREIGLAVKSSDNKEDLAEMIRGHKAMTFEKAVKDAAAAKNSQPSEDGEQE